MRLNEIFIVQWFSGFLNLSPIRSVRSVCCVNACLFTLFNTRANVWNASHYVFHVVIGEPRAPTGQHETFPFRASSSSAKLHFGESIVHQLVTRWWMYGRDDCGFCSRTAWQDCMWQNQQNPNRQKWWESEKRKPPTSLWMHTAHIHTFGANISEHGITKRATTRKNSEIDGNMCAQLA